MLKPLTTLLLITALAASLAGCNSKEKQDAAFRQRLEQQKRKSNAYPVNGSHTWTHYLP